uniref:Heat shock 70 kDa protein 14 n=1 Tax=Pygocentrus nattereri TaxID=42514 RepID=A0AAR2J8N3_PYGNA
MAAIGVHFGYTCACVAVFKDGRADVVANDAGDRVTPAVVAYRDTEQIVGIAAKQGRIRNAANTVVKVKQILGRRYICINLKLIHRCGNFESPSGKSHALVYKLGGTSLSVTALEVNSGMYRVLSTHTDHSTGGESFTHALAQHLAAEFKKLYKHDVSSNPRAMMKLMNSADVAKHTLSTLSSANCFVDSLYDGMDFECNVSRARFELICSNLFNKSIQPIKNLLQQVKLSTSDVNKVVLSGGSARIPKLQQMIRDLFPDVELLCSIPPDEVIPVGAAMQAGILVGKESLVLGEDSITVDCCASDILVKEVDESGADIFTVLFPSGTPLPARRQHTLQGPGSLASVCLELFQAQKPLAQIVLRDLEPKEEMHDILTVLTMKRDGSLHVTCTEQCSGRSEAVTIATAAAAS